MTKTMIILLLGDLKPVALQFPNEEAMIETAESHYSMVYEKWDRAKAEKRFGGQIPHDLDAALSSFGEVIEINYGEEADSSCLYDAKNAPEKRDVAIIAIFGGDKGGICFANVDQAREFVGSDNVFSDYPMIDEAKKAVKNALIAAGQWREPEDENQQ